MILIAYAYFPLNGLGKLIFKSAPSCDHASDFSSPNKLIVDPASAEIAMIPQNYVKLTGSAASQMLKLMEVLEDHDDVQHVYANFDIDEREIQAAMATT